MTLQRLSPEDRVLLRSDRDPRSRPTIGGLAILAGAPDWDLVRERLDRATRTRRALRERAVEPSLATTEPRWVIDPDFHLDRHLRHVALPAPADRAQLLALVEQVIAAPFDASGPLWTLTCVDLPEGGALVSAASPLVADEFGPIDLLDLALDGNCDADPIPPLPVPTDLEALDLARAGVRELPVRAVGLAVGGVNHVAEVAMRAVTDPRGLVDAARGLVTSPPPGRGSVLLAGRGTVRALQLLAFPRERFTQAPTHRGVERVHLAAVRAGLMRYHDALGLPQGTLAITEARHPSTMRRALAPASDPVASLGRLLPLLPGGVVDAVSRPSRGADIAVAAVEAAGASRLGAARLTERYAVGPVPGNALTAVALATPEEVFVAVRYDTEAIKDPELLARCLAEGFEDTLAPPAPTTARTKAPAKAPAKASAKAPAKATLQRAGTKTARAAAATRSPRATTRKAGA